MQMTSTKMALILGTVCVASFMLCACNRAENLTRNETTSVAESSEPLTTSTPAPTATPTPVPTFCYYELNCLAFDDEDNQHSNTFTGSSTSNVENQYTTWMENHGYSGGSYNINAVYSDGSKKPA